MLTRLACAVLVLSSAAWSASGLTYSTYLRDGFAPSAIVTDAAGNVYLAGSTTIDRTSSQTSAIVVKLNPTGAQYLYVRTIGGFGSDAATGIAVDGTGNAYLAGTTSSPDFPVTPGAQTGTLPAANQTRAFLVKLDPRGEVLFSDVLGSVNTTGLAVAIAADGGILVSGVSGAGLAASSGAYNVPNTSGRPFLMKLDPTGSKLVFTATGIGGNALALDSSGDIYMAGSTVYTDYPTTPGAYQSVLNSVYICYGICQIDLPGTNQYVTKVDPAGSKLIYSTGVGSQYQTVNNGLAVDAAGNAYVTGLAYGSYNWTVAQPNYAQVSPFLTKLDAAGAHALYSIQIGGAGVALDAQGDVYVGGAYNAMYLGFMPGIPLPGPPLGITNLPAQCQTNNVTTFSEGYVSHLDAATGNVLSTVLVDGSNASAAGIALAGGLNVWLAGPTTQADTPITPGALTPTMLQRGPLPGAYLSEIDFGASEAPTIQLACIVDAANLARSGVVAPNQLLTLYGTGLGPAAGIAATDYSTTSLGGVTVTFAGTPAPLLYVSSSQINVAVPPGVLEQSGAGSVNFATMQLSVNGVPGPARVLPVASSAPSVFADLLAPISSCTANSITYFSGLNDLATNAAGAINPCSNPAKPGAVISFFLNGIGLQTFTGAPSPWLPSQIPIAVTMGSWSAEVVNVSALNPFVWQVDVLVPPAAAQGEEAAVNVTMDLNLPAGVVPVGLLAIEPTSPYYTTPGAPFPLTVWVSP
ncbi:MAG: SBBP repeat-containing protein [Bryobacteraceae bacterium]